jgi:hypothetical protein
MKNPFEDKPEKFNEDQGLGILELEDVNTRGANCQKACRNNMVCSRSTRGIDNELS